MTKRKKFKHNYGLRNIYQFYKTKYDNPLDYGIFSKVLDKFNSLLIKELYSGSYITLPYTLGDLFIHKYKQKLKFDENGEIVSKGKRGLIDYKATKELWKAYPELEHKQRVYYDNFHTDNFKFKISWKRYHTLRAHRIYNFIPARAFKRGLASYLREHPNQNYYDK